MKTRDSLFATSLRFLPFLFALAFSFSGYTNIAIFVILFLSFWYLILNWQIVIRDRWALCVIGFFLAIAAKDGIMFALGKGSFVAFAKSGSRPVVLAGCSAMLYAHSREDIERALSVGFSVTFFYLFIIFIFMRFKILPMIYNANTFGMVGIWAAILTGTNKWQNKTKNSKLQALAILISMFILVLQDAFFSGSFEGSRTAVFAMIAALCFILLSETKYAIILARLELAVVLVFIFIGSMVFIPQFNDLLANRQYLWQAFLRKGLEQPLLGWGFTTEAANIHLVSSYMIDTPFYDSFAKTGLGPHNSFLAMFFENGVIALAGYITLLIARIRAIRVPLTMFDVSLLAYFIFMSLDAMAPGGLTVLGYFLGLCILAVPEKAQKNKDT
ncbi:MAG TPA: O-antigen ligase family protein [Rectinema sp.]|nr:O-antigen ligase family protein [Rectinema sp.]